MHIKDILDVDHYEYGFIIRVRILYANVIPREANREYVIRYGVDVGYEGESKLRQALLEIDFGKFNDKVRNNGEAITDAITQINLFDMPKF